MRKAFTLIELVIVIGIIGVLGAITLWGISSITKSAEAKRTRAALDVCNSMRDVVRRNGYPRPGFWYQDGVTGQHAAAGPAFWKLTGLPHPIITRIKDLSADRLDITDDLMANTIVAFANMANYPEARKMLDNLPTGMLREYRMPYTYTEGTQTVTGELVAQVPLDAWGRPILFIPAGGYSTVREGPIYTSQGILPYDATQWPPLKSPPAWPPVLCQMYFLSAGPDGQLFTDDDNLRSLDN